MGRQIGREQPRTWKHISVIGKGRLGTSLASAIRNTSGYVLHSHLSARKPDYKELSRYGGPHAIIIACRDDRLASLGKELVPRLPPDTRLVAHCAGSLAPLTLPVHALTWHPIQTFPLPDRNLFRGIHAMLSGSDSIAVTWGKMLVKDFGLAGSIQLEPEDLPLYHALAVMSSNFLILLLASMEEIAIELGWEERRMKRAVEPLMQQALRNANRGKALRSLTGPIARGDSGTIREHRRALRAVSPDILAIYDAFLKFAQARVGRKSK